MVMAKYELPLHDTWETTSYMNEIIVKLDQRTLSELPYEIINLKPFGNILVATTKIEKGALICEYKGRLMFSSDLESENNEHV